MPVDGHGTGDTQGQLHRIAPLPPELHQLDLPTIKLRVTEFVAESMQDGDDRRVIEIRDIALGAVISAGPYLGALALNALPQSDTVKRLLQAAILFAEEVLEAATD